jgi:DNA repair protein SbcC/Rad50
MAITAGKARLRAVDALRTLLADGKFLQYLTSRRTLALLGAASEIFARLSGGEFGFASEFQIISRRTHVIRSPKTLSGGETFLASLALALALVEMHSRVGATLGALFLDEGFAALDADALASSLAVLRAEAGGDKLVAVVSHLHAVAEAVEDVLWVERRPEGSSARWLTAAERDNLVKEDVASGLLTLV